MPVRFACWEPGCLSRWHYTPTCPYTVPRRTAPPQPRRPWSLEEWERSRAKFYLDAERAGEFNLFRTPAHVRQARREARAAGASPGQHRWLLVVIPVGLVLIVVMLGLLGVR
jgi:hypothetical protein